KCSARGSLKTENAYAWPMLKWIASAAGGMSHRLKVVGAMIASRSRTDMGAPLLGEADSWNIFAGRGAHVDCSILVLRVCGGLGESVLTRSFAGTLRSWRGSVPWSGRSSGSSD